MENETLENKPKSISSNALFYGALTGAGTIIYSLILYIAGESMNQWLSYFQMLILIAGMIWGTLIYRKQYLSGFMSYSQSFKSCFMIGLFAAIIGAVYTLIFFTLIDPGMIQQIMDNAREQMLARAPQMTDDQVDKALSIQKIFVSPVGLPIMALFMNIFYSALFALIISIFTKKEDKSLNQLV